MSFTSIYSFKRGYIISLKMKSDQADGKLTC